MFWDTESHLPTLKDLQVEHPLEYKLQPRKYATHLLKRYNICKSKRSYDLTEETTITRDEKTGVLLPLSKNPTCFVSLFQFNLPPVLTRDYCLRHQLTRHDLETIFLHTPVTLLSLLALEQKIEISNSSFPTHNSGTAGMHLSSGISLPLVNVSANSNTSIVKKFLPRLLSEWKLKQPDESSLARINRTRRGGKRRNNKEETTTDMSVFENAIVRLCCVRDTSDHIPPLPVHFVSSGHELEKIKVSPQRVYSHTWYWRGVDVVPQRHYMGYLKLVRVVPRTEYLAMYPERLDPANRPTEYLIAGHVFVEIKEAFLVQTLEAHKQICRFSSPELIQGLFLIDQFKTNSLSLPSSRPNTPSVMSDDEEEEHEEEEQASEQESDGKEEI